MIEALREFGRKFLPPKQSEMCQARVTHTFRDIETSFYSGREGTTADISDVSITCNVCEMKPQRRTVSTSSLFPYGDIEIVQKVLSENCGRWKASVAAKKASGKIPERLLRQVRTNVDGEPTLSADIGNNSIAARVTGRRF